MFGPLQLNNPVSRPNSQVLNPVNVNDKVWMMGSHRCELSWEGEVSVWLITCYSPWCLCPSSAELRPLVNTLGLQLMVAATVGRPASGGGAQPTQSLQWRASWSAEASHANIRGMNDIPHVPFLTGLTWNHCVLLHFSSSELHDESRVIYMFVFLWPLTLLVDEQSSLFYTAQDVLFICQKISDVRLPLLTSLESQ